MKKLMTLALGMAIACGTVTVGFAQEKGKDKKEETKKAPKKAPKKKKGEETKKS